MTKSPDPEDNATDQSSEAAVLDHSRLLSLVDGDIDMLRSITGLFLNSYPALLSDVRDAIESHDGKALKRAAHTLKGSGGYFLTNSARQILDDLEVLAQKDTLNDAEALMVELEREMERGRRELYLLSGHGSTRE